MGYKTMLAGQLLKIAGGKIKTGILNTKDNVSDYVAEKREQSQETQRLIRIGAEEKIKDTMKLYLLEHIHDLQAGKYAERVI